jgi:hypothetical protein
VALRFGATRTREDPILETRYDGLLTHRTTTPKPVIVLPIGTPLASSLGVSGPSGHLAFVLSQTTTPRSRCVHPAVGGATARAGPRG